MDYYMLAIDSSTRSASVALGNRLGEVEEIVFGTTHAHSSGLMPAIDRLLRRHKVVSRFASVEGSGLQGLVATTDVFHKERPGFTPSGRLAGIAFTLGPGSFTGIRVALATVKGLAVGWDLPLVPFNSLEVMAHGLSALDGTLVPLIDARKGEVFGAVYHASGGTITEVEPPFLRTPESLARDLAAREGLVHLFGGGALLYSDGFTREVPRARIIYGLPGIHRPRARVMARLAWSREPVPRDRLGTLNPIYIRPSDAEFRGQEAT